MQSKILLFCLIVGGSIFYLTKNHIIDPVSMAPASITTTETSLAAFSAEHEQLLDGVIAEVLMGSKIPGVVVGVRSPTLGTYMKGFGVSNVVTQKPMRIDAIFDIGSVHKNFKWVVLHLLEKEGQLDLDDLVNSYVTEPVLPGVTLRHLMQHAAGLIDIPDSETFVADALAHPTTEFSYDTMMDYLNSAHGKNSRFGVYASGRYVDFVVGVDSAYSSYGPLIANEVVKKVTGKNMRQLIDEKIIRPLGLTDTSHTGYDPDPRLLAPGHADYVTISPFTPNAASTRALSSANGGSIQTNVSDLLTYTHNQFTNPDFLSAQTIDDLTTEYVQGFGMKAGLGVIQFDQWVASNFWGHAGFGIRSHSTTMLHNIDHDLSIVVFANIYAALDNDFQTNLAISEAILDALY